MTNDPDSIRYLTDPDSELCKPLPILADLCVLHVFKFKNKMLVVIGNFNPHQNDQG
jgi:hypothetical protein